MVPDDRGPVWRRAEELQVMKWRDERVGDRECRVRKEWVKSLDRA